MSKDRLLYGAISSLYTPRQENIMDKNECQVERRDLLFFSEKFGGRNHVGKNGLVYSNPIFQRPDALDIPGLHFNVSITRAAILALFFAGRVDSRLLMDPCFASRRSRTLEASK